MKGSPPPPPSEDRLFARRERQMWLVVGAVFGICLALFLVRSSDPLAGAEASFQRLLLPERIVEFPLNPPDLPRRPSEQAEFREHGSNAVAVTQRHLNELFSIRTRLLVSIRYRLIPKWLGVDSYDLWTTDVARCALAIESLGEGRAALLPCLASNLFHEIPSLNRVRPAAELLGYTGPIGEKLLVDCLTNSNPRIRAVCVDGLRHALFRKATAPDRMIPINVDTKAWTSITNEHGFAEWRTTDWRVWGSNSGWMFATNGVWLLEPQLQDMRSPSIARRIAATSALTRLLKTNTVGVAGIRSNYVAACLELLKDAEPSERGRAASALASVGAREPHVITALERALTDTNRVVREDVTNALAKLR